MVKHEEEVHNGVPQVYITRIGHRERSLLHLTIREALEIERQTPGTSMNDRNEHGRGSGIIRIQATSIT